MNVGEIRDDFAIDDDCVVDNQIGNECTDVLVVVENWVLSLRLGTMTLLR